ncbi:hypothetical protein D3C84_1144230 [compost metagenome]
MERFQAQAADVAAQAVADGGRGDFAELGQPFWIEGFYVGIDQVAGGPFARRHDIKHEKASWSARCWLVGGGGGVKRLRDA